MAKVTIYDIAKELGVSASSVSRVMNGSALIGSETSRRIVETAEKLGYKKRNIRKQKGRAILNVKIILPHHENRSNQLFYDYSELLYGIKKEVIDNSVNLVTEIDHPSLSLFGNKKGGDVDAAIFAFIKPTDKMILDMKKRNIPFLSLNRILPEHDYITCDNEVGVTELIDLLYKSKENARPCFIRLSQSNDVATLREDSFRASLTKRGLSGIDDKIISIEQMKDLNPDKLKSLKNQGFNAFICFNDVIAVACLQAVQALGLKVPEEVSITGFDHSPLRDLIQPPIDTINLSVNDIGRLTGEWLLEKVINRSEEKWQKSVRGAYVKGKTL